MGNIESNYLTPFFMLAIFLRLVPRIINGGISGIAGVLCVFPLDLVKTRLQNQQEHAGIKEYKNILVPRIINGGISGIAGVLCVFPLDLVKTRLQNQQEHAGIKEYKNIIDAFKKTFRAEGFLGMYKGALVNALLITPEKAALLAGNDFFRYQFQTKDGKLPLFNEVMAAAAAGFLAIGITTPMELIKIQMQDAGRINAQLIKSGQPPMDLKLTTVVMNLIKADGPLAIFKGTSATMLRDIKFAMIYFPMFAKLNALGPKKEGSGASQFWVNFLAGGAAGCTAAVLCTPADVIKTRLQTATKGKGENSYTGIADAFRTILKNEGPRAFFKGGACRAMVIAPLLAIVQVVYYIGIAEYLMGIKNT